MVICFNNYITEKTNNANYVSAGMKQYRAIISCCCLLTYLATNPTWDFTICFKLWENKMWGVFSVINVHLHNGTYTIWALNSLHYYTRKHNFMFILTSTVTWTLKFTQKSKLTLTLLDNEVQTYCKKKRYTVAPESI